MATMKTILLDLAKEENLFKDEGKEADFVTKLEKRVNSFVSQTDDKTFHKKAKPLRMRTESYEEMVRLGT